MIQYFPTVTGSLTVNGDLIVTGTGSVSSSNAVSSSYAATASYANAFTVGGTLTAQTLVVQTITSSVSYITGSTRFGSLLTNTHTFTGSLNVTGSQTVFGNVGIGTSSPGQPLELYVPDGNGLRLKNSGSADKRWDFALSGNDLRINETGVTAVASFKAGGNVGIGTTNPSQKLEVVGGEIKAGRVDSSQEGGQVSFGRALDNSTSWYIDLYGSAASPQLRFVDVDNSAVRMTLTGSNVGIGISPSYKLDISSGASGVVLNLDGTNAYNAETGILMASGRAKISAFLNGSGGTPGSSLRFYTMPDGGSVTERIRVDSNGCVNIGGVAGYGLLDVCGQSSGVAANICRIGNVSGVNNGLIISKDTSNNYSYSFGTLGTGTVSATSGVLSASSDKNLKNDDGGIENALDKVLQLNPRYFHWKEESGLPTDIRQLGFYAQEVNEVLGEEVANAPKDENDKWGIYDRGLIAMLTKAIQELKAEFDNYKETHP